MAEINETILDNIDLDNIFVYEIQLPNRIEEYVTPCIGGYSVYLNSALSYERRKKAFIHALYHIKNDDFSKDDVQSVEHEAHKAV